MFDTNVLLSGLWQGPPFHCLELARSGRVKGLTCRPILGELAELGLDIDRVRLCDGCRRSDPFSARLWRLPERPSLLALPPPSILGNPVDISTETPRYLAASFVNLLEDRIKRLLHRVPR